MKSKCLIMLLLIVGYLFGINGQYEIKAAKTAEQLTSADDVPKYLPMYENGRKWVWRKFRNDDPETTISTEEAIVVGDTVINDALCKKIFYKDDNKCEFGYDENGVVFVKQYKGFMPFYRFDVEENDTLRYIYLDSFDNEADLSTNFKVDSIYVKNVLRKRITFSWADVDREIRCWVEGIGPFNAGPLVYFQQPTNLYQSAESREFVGCFDGEKCIFAKEDFSAPSITDKSIHGIYRSLHKSSNQNDNSHCGILSFSYDNQLLSVGLMSWKHRITTEMWPRAFVDGDVIRIIMDIVDLDYDASFYYDVSFSFPGIEPGRYTVMLMSDDGKEVQSTYELDLTDGFSKQFPDGSSFDGAIEISNDVDIKFDGTLVEFGSDGNATLELFTTEGVRLARAERSGTVRLSTGELMPGIYVVRATAADGRTACRKIAVK